MAGENKDIKKGYILKHFAGTLFFFLIIFISAGRFLYVPGLIYLVIGIVMATMSYTLLKPGHELLEERSGPGEGSKGWDKQLLGLSFLMTLAMYITAGLDSGRFGWSPQFPVSLVIAGIILTIAGQLLFLIAQKQNKFFSSTVRIQTERGHTVCDTGLYKAVRHPAYLGSVIQAIGFPMLFCSLWSIIPAFLLMAVTISRTSMEDGVLIKELTGYSEYAAKVKYRIIPFIW